MSDVAVFFVVAATMWAIFGAVGACVSGAKGRPSIEGGALGLLLGPFGLLIAVLLPTLDQRRPETASIRAGAADRSPASRSGRIVATARDDFLADALFLAMREGEVSRDAADPSRPIEPDHPSTPRRPSSPSRDLRA